MNRLRHIITLLLFCVTGLYAQNSYTVSGYVKDAQSGESLAGAVVYTPDLKVGVSTNEFGYYSIRVSGGSQVLRCSYTGYQIKEAGLDVRASQVLDFLLEEDNAQIEAATIFSRSKREEIKLPQMGKQVVDGALARKLPALMGEADIIRVIQMMPGVQSSSEGATGFSVRGGGVDQNLILMDGAPLYNAGHFLGFLSMFNGDAIKNVELYKGDFPSRYGGRMASVLDVSTVDGNVNSFGGNASIGLITSKIFVEGPIVKSKAGFMFAARRTYLDVFFPFLSKSLSENTSMYFYDMNAKLHWEMNPSNRLYLSAFSGYDVFGMSLEDFELDEMRFDCRNMTETLRWNHVFSPKLFSNVTLYNTRFDSGVGCDMTDVSFDYKQHIREYGLKMSGSWYLNPSNTVEFGLNLAGYTIRPGETIPKAGSLVQRVVMPYSYAIQPALFVQNEQKLGPVTLRYGLRFSTFTSLGETVQRYFDPVSHALTDSVHFASGKPIQSYHGLEPRLSLSWAINRDMSVKASYTRTYQYIQQAIVSVSGSGIDTWFTASPNVKPQISDQFSAGVNRLFADEALQLSLEGFYKNNKNTIDFCDNPGIVVDNADREGLLRFGRSYAYGAELMLKYDFTKWNGWVSYTWSKAFYDIPEINGGKPYRSPLNHEHAVNFVLTYEFNRKLSASADWVFYSGAPTTYPVGRFRYKDTYALIYSTRNEDSLPDYHRLDLSLTWRTAGRAQNKRFSGEWNASFYNAYSRHNAWSMAFGYNRAENRTEVRKVYLFTVIPSISYNIQF